MPQATPLVIHDGLLLKGSGPEIYLLEDHQLRRFSSPEAFDASFFRMDHVRTVEDSLLEQFEQGQPIRRLLRCSNSSRIYALEHGQKRWVKDLVARNPAKPWNKIHWVSCDDLRRLPVGSSIPAEADILKES